MATENFPGPDDALVGLYNKYKVARVGGTPMKHKGCDYFVLDLVHDRYAVPALAAYAEACKEDLPLLAQDLDHRRSLMERRWQNLCIPIPGPMPPPAREITESQAVILCALILLAGVLLGGAVERLFFH